jgi:hypothetical protein
MRVFTAFGILTAMVLQIAHAADSFQPAQQTMPVQGAVAETVPLKIGIPPSDRQPAATAAAEPDEATAKRIEAALGVLRTYQIGNDTKIWAGAIRDLIEIGKPAVPTLTKELDQTQRQETMRAIGFVLRGIGDPRAVPALIRAIPRTLQPGLNDYGLDIKGDDALLEFMQKHGEQPLARGNLFNYHRPFREVFAALHTLTGQKKWEMELNFIISEGSALQRQIQRELYGRLAREWAGWWLANWRQFVTDPADAQLGQIAKTVTLMGQGRRPITSDADARPTFPRGPKVVLVNSWRGYMIKPFDSSRGESCLDLDANVRAAVPPEELVKALPAGEPSAELVNWAEREEVDLIGVKIQPAASGKVYYGARLLGMRAWRIDDAELSTISADLQAEKPLDLSQPIEDVLAPTDRQTGKLTGETAVFLFVTREGAYGVLKMYQGRGEGAGPHDQASFDIYFIYDKSEAVASGNNRD